MDKEMLNAIAEMMEQQAQGILKAVDEKIERQSKHLMDYVDQRITKVEIKIENEVTKKIEALTDGYKLTHEKQWELERRVEKLERVIEELQGRIA